MRIEGLPGHRRREFNGPVVGLQERYRTGLAALGTTSATSPRDDQDARLRADEAFRRCCTSTACEGMYGAPEYGGNRDAAGWAAIDFPGDVQPRGYTDDEVAGP